MVVSLEIQILDKKCQVCYCIDCFYTVSITELFHGLLLPPVLGGQETHIFWLQGIHHWSLILNKQNLFQFLRPFSKFIKMLKTGAPQDPGGKSWHWPSRSLIPGQLGLPVTSESSDKLSTPRWCTRAVNLMLGPLGPFDNRPRWAKIRRQKSPIPFSFFSASDRILPSLTL